MVSRLPAKQAENLFAEDRSVELPPRGNSSWLLDRFFAGQIASLTPAVLGALRREYGPQAQTIVTQFQQGKRGAQIVRPIKHKITAAALQKKTVSARVAAEPAVGLEFKEFGQTLVGLKIAALREELHIRKNPLVIKRRSAELVSQSDYDLEVQLRAAERQQQIWARELARGQGFEVTVPQAIKASQVRVNDLQTELRQLQAEHRRLDEQYDLATNPRRKAERDKKILAGSGIGAGEVITQEADQANWQTNDLIGKERTVEAKIRWELDYQAYLNRNLEQMRRGKRPEIMRQRPEQINKPSEDFDLAFESGLRTGAADLSKLTAWVVDKLGPQALFNQSPDAVRAGDFFRYVARGQDATSAELYHRSTESNRLLGLDDADQRLVQKGGRVLVLSIPLALTGMGGAALGTATGGGTTAAVAGQAAASGVFGYGMTDGQSTGTRLKVAAGFALVGGAAGIPRVGAAASLLTTEAITLVQTADLKGVYDRLVAGDGVGALAYLLATCDQTELRNNGIVGAVVIGVSVTAKAQGRSQARAGRGVNTRSQIRQDAEFQRALQNEQAGRNPIDVEGFQQFIGESPGTRMGSANDSLPPGIRAPSGAPNSLEAAPTTPRMLPGYQTGGGPTTLQQLNGGGSSRTVSESTTTTTTQTNGTTTAQPSATTGVVTLPDVLPATQPALVPAWTPTPAMMPPLPGQKDNGDSTSGTPMHENDSLGRVGWLPGMEHTLPAIVPPLPSSDWVYGYDLYGNIIGIFNTLTGERKRFDSTTSTQLSSSTPPDKYGAHNSSDPGVPGSIPAGTSTASEEEIIHDPGHFRRWVVAQFDYLSRHTTVNIDSQAGGDHPAVQALAHLSELVGRLETLRASEGFDPEIVHQLDREEIPRALANYLDARSALTPKSDDRIQSARGTLMKKFEYRGQTFLVPSAPDPKTLLLLYQADRNPNGFTSPQVNGMAWSNYNNTRFPVVAVISPNVSTIIAQRYRLRPGFRPPGDFPVEELTVGDIAIMQNRDFGQLVWAFMHAQAAGLSGITLSHIHHMQGGPAGPLVDTLGARFYSTSQNRQRFRQELVDGHIFWQLLPEWTQLKVVDIEDYRPASNRVPDWGGPTHKRKPAIPPGEAGRSTYWGIGGNLVCDILRRNGGKMVYADLLDQLRPFGVDEVRLRRGTRISGAATQSLWRIYEESQESGASITVIELNAEEADKVKLGGRAAILAELDDPGKTPYGYSARKLTGGGHRALHRLLQSTDPYDLVVRHRVSIETNPFLYRLNRVPDLLEPYQADARKHLLASRVVYLALTGEEYGAVTLERISKIVKDPEQNQKSSSRRKYLDASDMAEFSEIFVEVESGIKWRLRPLQGDTRTSVSQLLLPRQQRKTIEFASAIDLDMLGEAAPAILINEAGDQLLTTFGNVLKTVPVDKVLHADQLGGRIIFRIGSAPQYDEKKATPLDPTLSPAAAGRGLRPKKASRSAGAEDENPN